MLISKRYNQRAKRMIRFAAVIKKFNSQGEKTGWTYIKIPAAIAEELKPGNKKSFRVKGSLDEYLFEGIALLPMGNGGFIMALNAAIRKQIKKLYCLMVSVTYVTAAYSLL